MKRVENTISASWPATEPAINRGTVLTSLARLLNAHITDGAGDVPSPPLGAERMGEVGEDQRTASGMTSFRDEQRFVPTL